MKKLFTLIVVAIATIAAYAGGPVTIYVKAEAAPFLYVWDQDGNQLNGAWPGASMTETATVDGVEVWTQTFDIAGDDVINIIFNDGAGQQTANIEGLTCEGEYKYTYDGATGYEDVYTFDDEDIDPSGLNLWELADVSLKSIWIGTEDWQEVANESTLAGNYELSEDGTSFTITNPMDVFDGEWRYQIKLLAEIETKAGQGKFDFSCNVKPSADVKGTIKLTNQDDPGDVNVFYDPRVQLTAGETHTYEYTDLTPMDANQLMLIFDFGGAPANTTIEITDICLKAQSEETGINTVSAKANNKNGAMYNLAGQRVGKDYKGIVIQNGKKFIKK